MLSALDREERCSSQTSRMNAGVQSAVPAPN